MYAYLRVYERIVTPPVLERAANKFDPNVCFVVVIQYGAVAIKQKHLYVNKHPSERENRTNTFCKIEAIALCIKRDNNNNRKSAES